VKYAYAQKWGLGPYAAPAFAKCEPERAVRQWVRTAKYAAAGKGRTCEAARAAAKAALEKKFPQQRIKGAGPKAKERVTRRAAGFVAKLPGYVCTGNGATKAIASQALRQCICTLEDPRFCKKRTR
jgi:hypothetical protein